MCAEKVMVCLSLHVYVVSCLNLQYCDRNCSQSDYVCTLAVRVIVFCKYTNIENGKKLCSETE